MWFWREKRKSLNCKGHEVEVGELHLGNSVQASGELRRREGMGTDV